MKASLPKNKKLGKTRRRGLKIGALSDSHDNLSKIEKAVRFFNKSRVDFVLHAGDFIAPFSILKLENLTCDWRGVLGNNDGEKEGLRRCSKGRISRGPLRIRIGNRKITLIHDINTINLNKEKSELIITGHSHKPQVVRRGDKLIVNPGECGGWLSGKSTIALVNLTTNSARIFKI